MFMPKISKCDVTSCAYNTNNVCHAMTIAIGDSGHPRCDTFYGKKTEAVDLSIHGGVGACKTSACRYNKGLECTAQEIVVGTGPDGTDCLTYQSR